MGGRNRGHADEIVQKWIDYFVIHKYIMREYWQEVMMISKDQVITIDKAELVGQHKILMVFNDGTKQCIDFRPFLSSSLNPLIRKYLDPVEFSKFSLDGGDLQWNEYDLCFPVADLYENRIMQSQTEQKT